MAPSVERPLGDLLTALAERSPAPGAGAAAAWAGAFAAALLEMVASFAGADAPAARAPILRAQLLESGEAELRCYEPVLEAMRAASTDRSRLEAALSAASDAPLAIARGAAEVAELGAEVAAQSQRALQGDAVAAVLLAEAASRCAARLVQINLRGLGEDARLAEVARLQRRAATARDRVQLLGMR